MRDDCCVHSWNDHFLCDSIFVVTSHNWIVWIMVLTFLIICLYHVHLVLIFLQVLLLLPLHSLPKITGKQQQLITLPNYRSVPQIRPPFCNLSLSTKRRGGLYVGCDIFSRDYAPPSPPLNREMSSGSVDAEFVLNYYYFTLL